MFQGVLLLHNMCYFDSFAKFIDCQILSCMKRVRNQGKILFLGIITIRQGRRFEKKPTRSTCPRVGHLYYYGTLFWGAKIFMWQFLSYDLKHMLKSSLMRPWYWKFFEKRLNFEWVMAILGCSCITPQPIDSHFLLMSTDGRGFESHSQQQSALWAKVEISFRAVSYSKFLIRRI